MKFIFVLVLLALPCHAGCSAGDKPVTVRPTLAGASPPPAKAKISLGPQNFKFPTELQLSSDQDLTITGPLVVHRIFYNISPDGQGFEKKTESYVATARPADKPSKRFVLTLERSLPVGKYYFLKIDFGLTNALGQTVVAEGNVKIESVGEAEETR